MLIKLLRRRAAFALAALVFASTFSVTSYAAMGDDQYLYYIEYDGEYDYHYENNIGRRVEPFADEAVYEVNVGNAKGGRSADSYYNSADEGYVTPVKDQGLTNCCWAFASLSALETDAIIKGWETADSVDFSEAHLTWFIYRENKDVNDPIYNEMANFTGSTPYTATGNVGRAVAALARGTGITDEEKYPFSPNNIRAMGYYSDDAYYDNNGYSISQTAELKDMTEIKRWIRAHGSCIANMYSCSDYFREPENDEDFCSYYSPCEQSVNHCINIVGWDDEFSADNFSVRPETDGAWIIKNSYGTEWGNDGYFYLSYCDPNLSGFLGFEIGRVDYDNIHTYNANPHAAILHAEKSIYSANIFHITKPEILEYVSFYTFTEDEQVTVELYQLDTATQGPSNGFVQEKVTVTVKSPGYHKMKLLSGNVLSPDSYYSVVLNSRTDDKAYVPVEVSTSKNYRYTKAPFQSFYSVDGIKWVDASKYGNVYINIYTKDTEICTHSFVTKVVPPSCTEGGFSSEECSLCNYIASFEELPAPGHITVTEVTPATCLVKSRVITKCEKCGLVFSEEEAGEYGEHQYEERLVEEGTKKILTCALCGAQKMDDEPAPCEHQYVIETVEPTCTKKGSVKAVCKLCGEVGLETKTDATGHNFVKNKVLSENGHEYLYIEECADCGAKGETEIIPIENQSGNTAGQSTGEQAVSNETGTTAGNDAQEENNAPGEADRESTQPEIKSEEVSEPQVTQPESQGFFARILSFFRGLFGFLLIR